MDSLSFSKFIHLCYHHHDLVLEHFHHPQKFSLLPCLLLSLALGKHLNWLWNFLLLPACHPSYSQLIYGSIVLSQRGWSQSSLWRWHSFVTVTTMGSKLTFGPHEKCLGENWDILTHVIQKSQMSLIFSISKALSELPVCILNSIEDLVKFFKKENTIRVKTVASSYCIFVVLISWCLMSCNSSRNKWSRGLLLLIEKPWSHPCRSFLLLLAKLPYLKNQK